MFLSFVIVSNSFHYLYTEYYMFKKLYFSFRCTKIRDFFCGAKIMAMCYQFYKYFTTVHNLREQYQSSVIH